ncbi:shufflon system plasmid conjugative transfer pilus tip adhesin PilV [Abyssalbus ytuae]|uniref:Shufflon system plasmid conjugative transfer pilus tip adhesin PilV n=1 Tax=Abyssalbus ytuae TaxID=2926907 RepID=A0A9E7A187_9FLAO|nr:shufflon system plasmid conjugative transfer pilus tip adhesin PilV [Abyssalbus ytuae]UOB17886.1 shufflon system plasmid conjugative transfer pilus tip adhesin PilV [Abyssalbus ytuae]
MKKILYSLIFISVSSIGAQNQDYYNTTSGNGHGFRFWNGNESYKIHMGNSEEYKYGPVTDYSIKTNMSGTPARGWTWGVTGQEPIAALNTLGNFQIAGNFVTLGNTGIGTTTPSGKLHVNGETYIENGWLRIKGSQGIFFQDYSGGFRMTDNTWIRTYGDKSFYHNTGIMRTDGTFQVGPGGNRLIVNENGFMGLAVTTPEFRLHVASGVKFRKTTIGATVASAENSWLRDDWLTGSYGPPVWNQDLHRWVRPSGNYNDIGGIIYQDEGTYFIRDGKGEQLEYTNDELLNKSFMFAHMYSGNVGIGTITPDSKLTVAGNIHSREVKVTVNAGADFVFDKDYNLPKLEKVQEFIQQNGHLPEIPSAADMEQNGIHLSEMNIKLLQKIEELTLYTIEQEEKLKKQEEEIEKLKEQNKKIDLLEKMLHQLISK